MQPTIQKILLMTALWLAGSGGFPADAAAPVFHIIIDSAAPYYEPVSATVSAGASIRWSNPTPSFHTVTHVGCLTEYRACLFDSGSLAPRDSFTIPGLAPGRYPYECRLHPIMRGLLIVVDTPDRPSHT
jgi:plastocyanin